MGVIGDGMDILKLVDKGHNAPLYKHIGEWIEKVEALQRERDDLKAEVNELRRMLQFKGTLLRIEGHVFVEGDDDEICPRCAEVDAHVVHMLSRMPQERGFPLAGCPECKTTTDQASAVRRNR